MRCTPCKVYCIVYLVKETEAGEKGVEEKAKEVGKEVVGEM